MEGLGFVPVVGTAFTRSHQPTQLSILSGSVNEYQGYSFYNIDLDTQAVDPHQLIVASLPNLRQQINIACLQSRLSELSTQRDRHSTTKQKIF